MVNGSDDTNEIVSSEALSASQSGASQDAANGIEKPIDVRVMSEDDTNKSRQDDTNKRREISDALRRLMGYRKLITSTMKLTTYTVKGNKYFRYQETSAKLRKINPPVHLSPYVRMRGKDKLTDDDKNRIEAFKQTRANKRRRRKINHPRNR